MDEETAFIAALLADPADGTVLLAYADWLQERDDPRAAYLRLLDSESPDHRLVVEFRERLDHDWVQLVASRGFAVGDLVRHSDIRSGVIVAINAGRTAAQIEAPGSGLAGRYEQPFTNLCRPDGPAAPGRSAKVRPVKPRRPPPPRRGHS